MTLRYQHRSSDPLARLGAFANGRSVGDDDGGVVHGDGGPRPRLFEGDSVGELDDLDDMRLGAVVDEHERRAAGGDIRDLEGVFGGAYVDVGDGVDLAGCASGQRGAHGVADPAG